LPLDNDSIGEIKIIDFGLSNSYSSKELLTTCCGTTQYAAPELLQGKKYFGPNVDVWSLGVLLYSLIVGDFPFHSAMDTLGCNYHIPSYFSSPLRNLLQSIFEIDPKNRITIRKLFRHPWVNKGFFSPPKQISPTLSPVGENVKLINYLKKQNLGYDNLESSILELTSASTMYHLTQQKLSRLSQHPDLVSTQTSPSDPLSYTSLSSLLPFPRTEERTCVIC